jgi:hypothetical protein
VSTKTFFVFATIFRSANASARSKVAGLVADDVEAGLEEQLRRREMLVVGRDDDDEVEALVGGRFGLGQIQFAHEGAAFGMPVFFAVNATRSMRPRPRRPIPRRAGRGSRRRSARR